MERKIKFSRDWRQYCEGDVVLITNAHEFTEIINDGAGKTVDDKTKLFSKRAAEDKELISLKNTNAELVKKLKKLGDEIAALEAENQKLKKAVPPQAPTPAA